MKEALFHFLAAILCLFATGQKSGSTQRFIRFYEDNDGINALFKGQDWGYTNGSRIDFFATPQKKKKIHQKITLFSPKHTTNSWSIMQVMITPQKTRPFIPDKKDYPYSGALMAIHTQHKADPYRKRILQTEFIAGVMGPPAFAKQTQIFLHRLIGDPRPNGWDYQLPTDLLLNYSLAYEKQVAGKNKLLLVVGANGFAGTLSNGLSAYTTIRFQKNLSYFSGLAGQYFATNQKKPGFAFSAKSSIDAILYNAVLEGGLFNSHSPLHKNNAKSGSDLQRKKILTRLDVMQHLSWRRFSLSFTQKLSSPDYKNYSSHKVGNISFYLGW
jgi:lipid A 3-O-deacylase